MTRGYEAVNFDRIGNTKPRDNKTRKTPRK